jgi:uncharacterized protein (UPF0335 family)
MEGEVQMSAEAAMVDVDNQTATVTPGKSEELRDLVERIERLEQEKTAISEDVKAVYQQAKSDGWDTKTIRRIVKIRKTDERTLQEEELLLETYKLALGIHV